MKLMGGSISPVLPGKSVKEASQSVKEASHDSVQDRVLTPYGAFPAILIDPW